MAYLSGSADLLLSMAMTHDAYAAQLLNEHIFHTTLITNVTELRAMIDSDSFVEMCKNLSQVEKTDLIVKWGYDTADYILTIDYLRLSFIIPSITKVKSIIVAITDSTVYCFVL